MSESDSRKLKVCIDLERCHGHARCLQEAPDVFGYGDTTNQAYVLAGADLEAHRESIDLAIDSCPERAISWATEASSSSKGSGS